MDEILRIRHVDSGLFVMNKAHCDEFLKGAACEGFDQTYGTAKYLKHAHVWSDEVEMRRWLSYQVGMWVSEDPNKCLRAHWSLYEVVYPNGATISLDDWLYRHNKKNLKQFFVTLFDVYYEEIVKSAYVSATGPSHAAEIASSNWNRVPVGVEYKVFDSEEYESYDVCIEVIMSASYHATNVVRTTPTQDPS